jgi:hypothetical protein
VRQKGFTPIIILLVVVLFGALGYLVYTKGYITQIVNKNVIQKTITPTTYTLNVHPTGIPDPTANWKTYINTTYKYSLKYPLDWKVEGEGGEDPTKTFAPSFSSTCNFDSSDRCADLVISLQGGYKEGKNLEYYFNIGSHIGTQDIISKKETVVGGEKALEIEYRLSKVNIGHENEPEIEIHAIHNNNVLLIQYGEQQKTSFSELKYVDIFNQILSTFKFTD